MTNRCIILRANASVAFLALLAIIVLASAAIAADAPEKASKPASASAEKIPASSSSSVSKPTRTIVKDWKLEELVPVVSKALKTKRNFEAGKQLFTEMSCSLCHHFGPDGGGVGPDLTGAGNTFSVNDLLENIIEPSKVISSLYVTTNVEKKDGDVVTGWIPEETDTTVSVMEDMFAAGKLTVIKRSDIAKMEPSKTSLMPTGLINVLKEDEIADLVAYLLSAGDQKHRYFK